MNDNVPRSTGNDEEREHLAGVDGSGSLGLIELVQLG